MKRMGKMAGALAALALAGGLTIAVTGTAKADVVPPGTWAEIFTPYTNNTACLDDPNGSASAGTPVQMYHCHGYASNGGPQRWTFSAGTQLGPGDTMYQVQSHGLCLGLTLQDALFAGQRVKLEPCTLSTIWEVLSRNAYPGDPDFELLLWESNNYGRLCATLPDWSGGNGEPIYLEPCDPGNYLQHWELG